MKGRKNILTCELLAQLKVVTEDQLRSAIRRRRLKPDRLPNGLFVWPPSEVKKAVEFFAWRKEMAGAKRGKANKGGE